MSELADKLLNADFESEFRELNIKLPGFVRITDIQSDMRCVGSWTCNKKVIYRCLNKTYCWYHALVVEKTRTK
jgi:hypothetical protein